MLVWNSMSLLRAGHTVNLSWFRLWEKPFYVFCLLIRISNVCDVYTTVPDGGFVHWGWVRESGSLWTWESGPSVLFRSQRRLIFCGFRTQGTSLSFLKQGPISQSAPTFSSLSARFYSLNFQEFRFGCTAFPFLVFLCSYTSILKSPFSVIPLDLVAWARDGSLWAGASGWRCLIPLSTGVEKGGAVTSDHPPLWSFCIVHFAFSSFKGYRENCLETLIFCFLLALPCGEKWACELKKEAVWGAFIFPSSFFPTSRHC